MKRAPKEILWPGKSLSWVEIAQQITTATDDFEDAAAGEDADRDNDAQKIVCALRDQVQEILGFAVSDLTFGENRRKLRRKSR